MTVAREMQRLGNSKVAFIWSHFCTILIIHTGMRRPLLIGGATTSRVHTAVCLSSFVFKYGYSMHLFINLSLLMCSVPLYFCLLSLRPPVISNRRLKLLPFIKDQQSMSLTRPRRRWLLQLLWMMTCDRNFVKMYVYDLVLHMHVVYCLRCAFPVLESNSTVKLCM